MKRLFIFLSLFTLPVLGFSQSKVTISFKIMDTDTSSCLDTDVQKSFLFQYNENNVYGDVKNFLSNKCSNSYTISKVPGNFRIQISAPGYESQSLHFDITEQSKDTLNLGDVYLLKEDLSMQDTVDTDKKPSLSSGKEKEIEGVTVTGIREKYIKFDANKTTYTVKDNDLLSGGSTEEALTKIPGVIKGYGGQLTVNGKTMSIYIDDTPTGLSGGDLENLLQSIPATSIEKIEIISNPGASYEANTGGGIINIITNGRALRGLNGTATLNYRFNKSNRVSPSINLNSRIKNVSLQLNSGFNYREAETVTIYKREFTYFTPSIIFDQKNKEEAYNRFYFFRPSANIRLNNKSNLLINYNFSNTYNNTYNNGESTSANNISPISLLNNSRSSNNNINHELITKYKTKLDTLGKVFDITAYYSHFDKNTINRSIQNNLGINNYSINDVDSRYDNFYAKTNFEIPFKKLDMTLNAGGKYSVTNTSSKGKYNLLNSSSSILRSTEYTSFTNFNYEDNQYALYGELSKKFKSISITAGLRYENLEYTSTVKETNQKVKHSLDNLYPSFSFLYKINPVVNFNASYRKSISLPSYSSMDPNISGYYDEYNTSTGNLYLQPDYYDNYEVSISAFNYLKLSFQYTYSKNINLMYFETQDNSLAVNQTTRSFNGMKNYNISLGIPVPFGLITKGKKFFNEPMNMDKMSFVYFYGMYNYYKVDDYPYTDSVKPIWFYAFYSQIALPKEFKLTAFYMFSSDNGYFRIYKTNKPFNYSNIELSRSFYNKSIKASIGINNIFNSTKFDARINNYNLNTNFYQRNNDQLYYFKISYNFGKLRNINKENHTIDNDKKSDNELLLPAAQIK